MALRTLGPAQSGKTSPLRVTVVSRMARANSRDRLRAFGDAVEAWAQGYDALDMGVSNFASSRGRQPAYDDFTRGGFRPQRPLP